MNDIPIILLAAGGSGRMGQPKQLLRWGNSTLIENRVEILLDCGNPLYVVLGSEAKKISSLLKKYPVRLVFNPHWEKGMGTSVASGMKQLLAELPSADAVLFALVDQPLVTASHFCLLIEKIEVGKEQILVSRSDSGWEGVPAVFDRFYFTELENLDGKLGAKTLIGKHPENVISINAGNLLADMDTPERYRELQERSNRTKR